MSRYSRKSDNSSGPITSFYSPSSSLRGGATSPFASSFHGGATSSFASSSSSHFTAMSSTPSFFNGRSSSPTRVHLVGTSPPRKSPAVRYASPVRSAASAASPTAAPRRTCMCSPTTHPGSFRCSLHKNARSHPHHHSAGNPLSNRLNARRSAMTNSLVRIGTVEGDLVKRALAALIRPSSHSQRCRDDFRPRPSRLSVMTKASDHDNLR